MYVGFLAGWIGLWVVFGRANRVALVIVCVATLAVGLLVKFYEEPTLRKMLGPDYEEYCRTYRAGFRVCMHGADEAVPTVQELYS